MAAVTAIAGGPVDLRNPLIAGIRAGASCHDCTHNTRRL
jgi:hypothetical protein